MIYMIILSLLQFFAIMSDLAPSGTFRPFSITQIPLFILILLMTRKILSTRILNNKRQIIIPAVLGNLFSFFILAGHSFETTGNLSEISLSLKTITVFIGYAIFFYMIISLIFLISEHAGIKEFLFQEDAPTNRYSRQLHNKPFTTAFLTLLILTLPNIIISFPGVMSGDIYFQIQQGFGLENKKNWAVFSPNEPVLYKTVDGERVQIKTSLSNYHPIAHTMLLHWCMEAGNMIFHSDNAGLFLLVVIQNELLNIVLAYCIKILIQRFRLSSAGSILLISWFIFHPSIRTQMVTVSKEGMYIPFLMLTVFEIAVIICGRYPSLKKELILLIIACIGTILFRNEGKFILAGTFFLLILFSHEKRKIFIGYLFGVIAFSFVYEILFLPAMNVAPGSIREALSVPFQQTARYVRDAENMVTDQEKKHIDSVLQYDSLGERYNPENADPVKGTYRETTTISDLKRYAFTWLDMLMKRPDIYILATMNNYYKYFYPTDAMPNYFTYSFGASEMWLADRDCAEINLNLYFPNNLSALRKTYENVRNWIFSLPGLRIVWVSAFYVWILLIYEAWCIVKKNRIAFLIGTPMLIQLLIYMTGPTNGSYSRYIFIMKACIPLICLIGSSVIHCQSDYKETCNQRS